MKILLAEDDSVTRYMMTEMLSELRYDFDICENGGEAVTRISESPGAYSIVLMDIHMPEMTGIEATTRIRAASENPPREIPIVAMTADKDWQNRERCLDVGFSDVLPKPVSLSLLKTKIDEYRLAG